ncbi:MAG: FAD-dependent oxidoreductase [Planctomycetota bacterium]
MTTPTLRTPIAIIGGGTGGVAAALALARIGQRCVLVEPTHWIGGQLTSQAVPPDEHRWIESFGCTRSYRDFRNRVRAHYRAHESLTPDAAANDHLNPGGGWVSRLCMEPRVAHAVLRDMLEQAASPGVVTLLTRHTWTAAETHADRVTGVTLTDLDSGAETHLEADYFLDATELGDLLALADVEHRIGAEGKDAFGELHAPEKADPNDQQAFSWCFALEHRPGEDHTIDRPDDYDFWRTYIPDMRGVERERWTYPLFSWTVPSHNDEGRRTFPFVPPPDEPSDGAWDMWRYRRIVEHAAHTDVRPDVCLVNWVQMDYWQKPLLGVSPEAQREALAGARAQSRAFLYWMQTDAPRHDSDTRTGYAGLKLHGDALGSTPETGEGFAQAAYIREPRRLVARTTIHEGHVGTQQRAAEGHLPTDAHEFGSAHPFADSVGIGHYPIDLHPSTAGRNSIYVGAAPFQIPMGALVPVRTHNVLAAGKCLGVTHVTNGCYRLHPVEWNIGEAAGMLAAWSLKHARPAADIHADADAVAAFQNHLVRSGFELRWPWDPA